MTFDYAGELLLRSEELNSQLCSSLSSRATSLMSPADKSNPFALYDYLLVYHPEEHTATMELLAAVEKGIKTKHTHTYSNSTRSTKSMHKFLFRKFCHGMDRARKKWL